MSSIEAINTRIARLALALGVSLNNDGEVVRLMSQHQTPVSEGEHRSTPNRPMDNQWRELRGLLVLRYGVETAYVGKIGVTATRQILVEAEQHLLLHGFHLGDDGMALDLLFNESGV